MKAGLILVFALAIVLALGGYLSGSGVALTHAGSSPDAVVRFRIQPSESKFVVTAFRGGLLYFKGHNHIIAIRDFEGEASLDLDSVDPASLQMSVNAASLEETSDVFTPQQKDIIKKELNEIVLETAKYPKIDFRSTMVRGGIKNGRIDVIIGGDMIMHGVTRHVDIPAAVTVEGDTLRAKGEFDLDRKKFNVNATTAAHGLVRVKHKLRFTFDIVAHRV